VQLCHKICLFSLHLACSLFNVRRSPNPKSVIFRNLQQYHGNKRAAANLNVLVRPPWHNLNSAHSLWKPDDVDYTFDMPMQSVWHDRLHFNLSKRHIATMGAVHSRKNCIISVLLTSPINLMEDNANSIAFQVPKGFTRATALENKLSKSIRFRVYCKMIYFNGQPKKSYLYCGVYFIVKKAKIDNKLYCILRRNEYKLQ
jgi:hypothetical protein